MKIKSLSLFNLLIILSVLIAWLITAVKIEPFLHYHNQQIGFNTGFGFLKSFLDNPGGISDYAALFISQFFKFNNFGSLLITFIASLQGLLALNITRRIFGKTKIDFLFFAAFLIIGVIILCDYRYPYYASIRLFFAIVFSWIFSILNKKYTTQSIFIWPVLAVLNFYLASGAALIVFTVSTSCILIFSGKRKIWLPAIPIFLLFGGLVPFLSYKLVFPTTLMNLYRLTEVKPPEMLAYNTLFPLYVYYSILPLALVFAFLLNLYSNNLKKLEVSTRNVGSKIRFYRKPQVGIIFQFVLFIATGYFLFTKSYDTIKKKLIYVEYYAQNNQWKEILDVAETTKLYDFRVNFQVNRAYAHFGLLPDRLFFYPQVLGVNGLFLDASTMNGSFTMPLSDLYFDLGFMSESLHWAFEAQTLLPNSPRILKRLVMIYLITGKYDLAGEFLNVLDKNILYRSWVNKYRGYIGDTTLTANDPLISEKRRFTPVKRSVNMNPYQNLKLLLETNKDNRMAYDYLMALSILDTNYPEFIDYLEDYSYYNIKTMPRSWEETLTFYIIREKEVPAFVNSKTVSQECIENFRAFNNVMKQFNGNKDAAKNALRRDFENTFWYYLIYLNPRVTNVINNKTEIR